MTVALTPGTVLGGRYQLDDLLDDVEGARFWRATDTVLARSVAVHVLAEDDERTTSMLEAAKLSATVADPHLLRVLDADVREGLAWVINEWGQGQSLDIMVTQRPLPPDRAAWFTREVALAIAVAHGAGLAHGRLAPENVMITESGTVRIIGFAIDACLQRRLRRSGNYPRVSAQEADVVDLAGLLYTGLVGKWPGASGSVVTAAPRDVDGPLRPRQVRAGVPRALDLICARVLDRGQVGRSAHQLAAVLAEYLGEPGSPDPAVVTPAALHGAAVPPEPEPEPEPEPDPEPDTGEQPTPDDDPELTVATPYPLPAVDPAGGDLEADEPDLDGPDLGEDDQPWSEPVAEQTVAVADPTGAIEDTDAEATQRVVVDPLEAAADDPDWYQPSAERAPPPPDPEPVPERPLFAPGEGRRTPRAELPRSETAAWGSVDHLAASTAAGSSRAGPGAREPEASWPFGSDPEEERDDWEERTRRHWLRIPVAVLVVAVVLVVVSTVFGLGGKVRNVLPGAGAPTTAAPDAQPSAGQVLRVRAVKDLDPFGVPPEENPDEVKAVIDGDPSTAWETKTYRGRPDLGGLKPGVGVVLDLGSIQPLGSVTIGLVGSPTDLAIYTAPTATTSLPSGIEGLTKVAAAQGAGTRVRLAPDRPVRTRYVVVWLTSLPAADGGYRGGISGVVVRS